MRFKADAGGSNTGLFRGGEIDRRRPTAWLVRTANVHLPLASFTESSGFSVCSYPSGGTGLFPTSVAYFEISGGLFCFKHDSAGRTGFGLLLRL